MASDSIIGVVVIDVDVDAAVREIEENWGWILAEGMVQVIFGALSFALPILSTAYVGLYANWALVVSGLINIMGLLFAERGLKIRCFLLGLVQLGLGAILELYPLESLEVVTTLIASMFMADGLFRLVLAEQNRGLPGWFWTFMSGLTSIAAGAYVLYTLPLSSLETIGTLVGINLMSAGSTRIKIASLGRSLAAASKKKQE
jgi:uncharacterized membrane protein HdeD (DUF308 family)